MTAVHVCPPTFLRSRESFCPVAFESPSPGTLNRIDRKEFSISGESYKQYLLLYRDRQYNKPDIQ